MLSENTRWVGAATVLARVGLGTAFLSAVADRLGLWGPAGTNHVFWGNFHNFTEYLRSLAPYLPAALNRPGFHAPSGFCDPAGLPVTSWE